MSNSQVKYALIEEQNNFREFNWIRLCILVAICAAASIIVYSTWNAIYQESLNIPPKYSDIPMRYYNRTEIYSEKFYKRKHPREKLKLFSKKILYKNGSIAIKQIENERIYPSKYGNFIYKQDTGIKLVCYYEAPTSPTLDYSLHLSRIDAHLCTHLNVGVVNVFKNQLVIDARITNIIIATKELKQKNKNVKVLLWVGGTNTAQEFSKMIAKGNKRKIFIQSLISVLEENCLDGVDFDWEFPEAFKQEHEHFAQLLHEIRREYQRQHRTYLLSVAVAAPEEIVYFSYDIAEMNSYVDYFNIFSFDYHSYTKQTPFTGINAPLYPRQKYDNLYLKKVNINYTVNMWLTQGLDRRKVIVGLPTYGHSFRLVNPFNTGIGSPAEDFGRVGTLGFASYSEVCWFKQNNIYVTTVYDVETCSPYLYAGVEWISYEDERSIECKARYVKEKGLGGVMIFSLNTDDYGSHCQINVNEPARDNNPVNSSFPLLRKIYSVLFDKEN